MILKNGACSPNHFGVILSLPLSLAGCRLAPSASPPPLFLPHPRPLSLPPLPHVDGATQRRLVLLALDAFHFHGNAPRARRRAPRPLGVPVWQHGAAPLLAVRQHHGDAPPPVLGAHVFDGNQGRDLHQTRGGHRRLGATDHPRISMATPTVWFCKTTKRTIRLFRGPKGPF